MPKKQTLSEIEHEQQIRRQRKQIMAMGAVGGIVLLIFAVLAVILIRAANSTTVGPYDQLFQTSAPAGFPILGDSRIRFSIAEFSAFGCADCLGYEPTIKQAIDKFVRTGQARLVLVYVPTETSADNAAQAALCAGSQHKFWEMRDALDSVQGQQGTNGFSLDNLRSVAQSVGADGSKISDCMTSGTTRSILTSGKLFFSQEHGVNLPFMLWSTDGVKWQPFIADNNVPYAEGGVPFAILARTLADYNNSGG